MTVASGAHRSGKIRLDDLNWEHGYRRYRAYGQAKLANLLFMSELQRRLDGGRLAPYGRSAPTPAGRPRTCRATRATAVENALMAIGNRVFAQSGDMGALPTLYAATQDVPGDAYIGPGGPGEMRGHPAPASRQRRRAGRRDGARALGALGASSRASASRGSRRGQCLRARKSLRWPSSSGKA